MDIMLHAAVLILAILLPMLMAAAFLLARHLYRRVESIADLSPVTRQHIDLFQGGQLSEVAVEAAKTRFRDLLERGEVDAVEASVQPQVVTEARLGELIEDLWDHRPQRANPLIVRVLVEALRVLRRAPHAELLLTDEHYEQEAFSWQMSHLASLEQSFSEYLEEAVPQLCGAIAGASADEQRDLLSALADVRAEAASALL